MADAHASSCGERRWGLLALLACVLACCHQLRWAAAAPGPGAVAAAAGLGRHPPAPDTNNASVTIDLTGKQPISQLLYGIFFEEIGHAGDGGLYAELVQDRSFMAVATATGFITAPQQRLPVRLSELAGSGQRGTGATCDAHPDDPGSAAERRAGGVGSGCGCGMAGRQRRQKGCSGNDIIIAWHALPGTTSTLTKEQPLNAHSPVSMELTSSGIGGPGGIVNEGYWGVPIEGRYTVTLYLRAPSAGAPSDINATVSLLAGGGLPVALANASLAGLTAQWQKYSA